MNIEQQISEIVKLHDAYSADKYNENRSLELSNQFDEWHSKSATLFSHYVDADDEDLKKFKNITKGNSYVLAGVFSDIEAYFHVLVDKLRSSVAYQLENLIGEGWKILLRLTPGILKFLTPVRTRCSCQKVPFFSDRKFSFHQKKSQFSAALGA